MLGIRAHVRRETGGPGREGQGGSGGTRALERSLQWHHSLSDDGGEGVAWTGSPGIMRRGLKIPMARQMPKKLKAKLKKIKAGTFAHTGDRSGSCTVGRHSKLGTSATDRGKDHKAEDLRMGRGRRQAQMIVTPEAAE